MVKQLDIASVKASTYHLQLQGTLDRAAILNVGLTVLLYLMFTIHELVQEYSFELVFGHSVRGPLQLIKKSVYKMIQAESNY